MTGPLKVGEVSNTASFRQHCCSKAPTRSLNVFTTQPDYRCVHILPVRISTAGGWQGCCVKPRQRALKVSGATSQLKHSPYGTCVPYFMNRNCVERNVQSVEIILLLEHFAHHKIKAVGTENFKAFTGERFCKICHSKNGLYSIRLRNQSRLVNGMQRSISLVLAKKKSRGDRNYRSDSLYPRRPFSGVEFVLASNRDEGSKKYGYSERDKEKFRFHTHSDSFDNEVIVA